jgi:hypothetical protein
LCRLLAITVDVFQDNAQQKNQPPHPVNECMKKERGFAAIRHFLDSGLRSEWLKYRFVA